MLVISQVLICSAKICAKVKATDMFTLECTNSLAHSHTGLPFRAAVFDAVISVSAVQWLLAGESKPTHNDDGCHLEGTTISLQPVSRALRFFRSLHRCLKPGGRAILQLCGR